MASKFINTQQKMTIDNIIDGFQERVKNPYYKFTDLAPTPVTYYHINRERSTLDEALKIEQSRLGDDSPLRFDRINNMMIYSVSKINVDLDVGEYGLESSPIEGEAYILPNTIEPFPNDYFVIDYLKTRLLFKVLSSTPDTIENDANFWKIEYKLDRMSDDDIKDQVVEEFEMIINNVCTEYKSIIRKNDYNFIGELERILDNLRKFYTDIFYNERVQTFTFENAGKNFYDDYMIEFLKKHQLLEYNGSDYVYINHQLKLPKTFNINYNKTFYNWVENPDLKDWNFKYQAQGLYINDFLSVFDYRPEKYFKLDYIDTSGDLLITPEYILECFGKEFIHNLKYNKKYDNDYKNIIIDHFYGIQISPSNISLLNNIEFDNNMDIFYNIPVLIYILEIDIKDILKTYK